MRDALAETLVVLAYSTKTQLALVFGLIFFFGVLASGNYFSYHFELHGLLAPLTDVIREQIVHRYDKVAWAALASFLGLAFRSYQKDRKRLFGI